MAWTFIHIWRVVDGQIVEHWACRDDMTLLEQHAADWWRGRAVNPRPSGSEGG